MPENALSAPPHSSRQPVTKGVLRMKNAYRISDDGTYAIVELTQGQVTLIDIEDLPIIENLRLFAQWQECKQGYYARYGEYKNGKTKILSLHRTIMKAKKGEIVDHISGDGLDNRKQQLRICTSSQNAMNRRTKSNNSSGKKGVYWSGYKWVASISIDGKVVNLGRFYDYEDAVRAREEAEKKFYGEFFRDDYSELTVRKPVEKRNYLPEKFFMEGYGEVYRVPLTQGKYAIIDIEDYEKVSAHKWSACYEKGNQSFYARTNIKVGEKIIIERLHRLILSAKKGEIVDHINGDTLDNRRCNLRFASAAENIRNSRRRITNTSGFKGVYWNTQARKWQADIRVLGKKIYLGRYDDPKEAHEAYCAAALKYHKEFANFG